MQACIIIYKMPSCLGNKVAVSSSVIYSAILVLSLAVSSASLGLLQANVFNGQFCFFFFKESDEVSDIFNPNTSTCKLSVASIAIATICLSILATIQLVRVVFQASIKT